MAPVLRPVPWLLLATALACAPPIDDAPTDGDDTPSVEPDTGAASEETGADDTDTADTDDTGLGSDTADTDVARPLDGLGTLGTDCAGQLAGALGTSAPAILTHTLDLGTTGYVEASLSADAQVVATTPNEGGSSLESEAVAFDVAYRCDLADLLKTEAAITYTGEGSKADLLYTVGGTRIGSSVTRAYVFPPGSELSPATATDLLTDKLEGLQEAATLVDPVDAWDRSVLQVIAWNADYATTLAAAWADLPSDVTAQTVVWVTVTDGDDGVLYGVEATARP